MTHAELLDTVSGVLKGFSSAREIYALRLAPGFNTFQLLNPNENALSAVLARLLDPAGNHSQGDLFLGKFIEQFLPEHIALIAKDGVNVKTEDPTSTLENERRRIDLVVRLPKLIIGFENKPWAIDQDEQVSAYLEHLKNSAGSDKDFVLIYLSGDGSGPGESSISKVEREKYEDEKQFKTFSYGDLIGWLDVCKPTIRAPTVTNFIDEMRAYIQAQFMGIKDMEQTDAVIAACERSEQSLQAAIDIQNALPVLRTKLIGHLRKQVKGLLVDEHSTWVVLDDEGNEGKSNWLLRVKLPDSKRYEFTFEFEEAGFNRLKWGIRDLSPNSGRKEFSVVPPMKSNRWWILWDYFENDFLNWGDSARVWMKIRDDDTSLARNMVDKMIGLYQKIDLLKEILQ